MLIGASPIPRSHTLPQQLRSFRFAGGLSDLPETMVKALQGYFNDTKVQGRKPLVELLLHFSIESQGRTLRIFREISMVVLPGRRRKVSCLLNAPLSGRSLKRPVLGGLGSSPREMREGFRLSA